MTIEPVRLLPLLFALAAGTGLLQADPRCGSCHPSQVRSWLTTGMARSITAARGEPPSREDVRHAASGTTFRVSVGPDSVIHEAVRGGRKAAYPMLWAIGSGNHGKSYIHRLQDALFQSPLSWYASPRAYELSPGFEGDANPDFFRPVTPDCLFCHAGRARLRPGTQNRYLDPPFQPAAIGCERCHGDPAVHLAQPVKRSIVNPARLTLELRDAVCEQCHLSGEARIPNPGRQFADFQPGMRMEDVFSVYVGGASAGLKVVSHSEQMALSRCFRESGQRMWCGTCHDPHSTPADKVSWYREKCRSCHAGTSEHERKKGPDCAGCHMPRLKPYDGGHTAFTDHWIRAGSKSGSGRTEALRAWREPEPALRDRNLGLAWISVASKTGDMGHLMRGYRLLGEAPADGAVEIARGMVLLRLNKPAEAVMRFRRAVNEQPADSTRRYNLAVALLAAGDRSGALRSAQEAIALEPLMEDAYVLAAEIEPHRAAEWKRRWLRLAPGRLLP